MTADRKDNTPGFLTPSQAKEKRSAVPIIVAAIVVLAIIAALLFFTRGKQVANPGGAGLAANAPYASNLTISNVQMSESTSLSGAKDTYIDGQIINRGDQTLSGITVQVAFRDALNQITQKETMPLMLIRAREPYIDTQAVSVAPIEPGEQRPFRLIFDHVSPDWNGQYPEIRVIEVSGR